MQAQPRDRSRAAGSPEAPRHANPAQECGLQGSYECCSQSKGLSGELLGVDRLSRRILHKNRLDFLGPIAIG